jgi:hypothetical protein
MMHLNTSEGAAAALAALAAKRTAALKSFQNSQRQVVAPVRTAKDHPCPDCGWPVINWYSPNHLDPGDVDPRADCTNPDCGWGY